VQRPLLLVLNLRLGDWADNPGPADPADEVTTLVFTKFARLHHLGTRSGVSVASHNGGAWIIGMPTINENWCWGTKAGANPAHYDLVIPLACKYLRQMLGPAPMSSGMACCVSRLSLFDSANLRETS